MNVMWIFFSLIFILNCCLTHGDLVQSFKDNVVDETKDVRNSIRPSLLTSIQTQFHNEKVVNLISRKKLDELENFIQNYKLEINDQILKLDGYTNIKNEDLERIKNYIFKDVKFNMKSEFGGGVLAFIEALMKGMMNALELDLKDVFNALVAPLIELAITMNPLPEYQYTTTIMDGTQEMRYIEETFENWGSTLLANVTVRTFFPRTVAGIQNVVRAAGKEGARVRASATRHTFNPWLWGVESNLQPGTQGHNVDYVVAMLPLEISDHLAYAREDGKKHAAVKFGASTLNLHYYDWALANNWTMPANTIMHYMTIGGVALGTCHGGGIGHQTIADRIIEMEYVDSNGELQVINDPQHLKVAAGSMGMLGTSHSMLRAASQLSSHPQENLSLRRLSPT